MIRALDDRDPDAVLEIESAEALEPRPEEPKGVYCGGGRSYYLEED